MAKEIEKKFLVQGEEYKNQSFKMTEITQGYLCSNPESTVRVRIKGDNAFLTVKGLTIGNVRDEWEYSIPLTDAWEMIDRLCDCVLRKNRYEVNHGGLIWEIDEFKGRLSGLVLVEVELPSSDYVIQSYPTFVGKDVTNDCRYYNSCLVNMEQPPE